MHGLRTIAELNRLAVQNAPGAAEAALNTPEAVAARKAASEKFDQDIADSRVRQEAARQRTIELLLEKSNEELVSLVNGAKLNPSTLEAALAARLRELAVAFGVWKGE